MAPILLSPYPILFYLLTSLFMASSQIKLFNSRPLNRDAQPFYPVSRKHLFLKHHFHLPYDRFYSSSFHHPNTMNPIPAGTQYCRISVSTNKNLRFYHKFPMRYGRNRVKYEWRVKGTTEKAVENCSPAPAPARGNGILFPTTIEEAQTSKTTTLMIRNIPNQFKFRDLLQILDEHCYEENKVLDDPADYSKFDFLYLPMDYRKHAIEKRLSNLGYAFVNFTTPTAAFKFYKRFHGFVWRVSENKKTCEINTAQHQGKESLIRIFQQKVFCCKCSEFLPFVFSEARDGFNCRIEGTSVGRHVWGLPRKSMRS